MLLFHFFIIIFFGQILGCFVYSFIFYSRVEKDIYYHLRQRHAGHRLGHHHRIYSPLVVDFVVHKNHHTQDHVTFSIEKQNKNKKRNKQLYLNIYEKKN
jgi:hypothetical protein